MSGESEIYNISWVRPDNFDPNKVVIAESGSKINNMGFGGSRMKITYKHVNGEKDFLLTVPLEKEAFFVCRGVQKNVFTQGDIKVETNRYVAPLVLDGDNKYHMDIYNVLEKLQMVIKSKTGAKNIVFPIKDVNGKYSIIYANLIHSHDGRMFSTAYTDEEQINILDCKKCLVRPALLISAIRKSAHEYKIQIQISQMYIHEQIKDFPLAIKN